MRWPGSLLAIAFALSLTGSAGAGISVPPPPGDFAPTWSPDGSVIVFFSGRDGDSLRVVDPDGSGEHRIPWLPATTGYSFSHDWSHVGAVTVDGSLPGYRVVVGRLEGSDRLDLGPAVYASPLSWSPDGARVVFATPSSIPNVADLVVARIDGTEAHRVADGFQPDWSPAGNEIAYVAGAYETNEIRIVDADGGGDRNLVGVPNGGNGDPRWSPDGTRLAVVHRPPGGYAADLDVLSRDGLLLQRFEVTTPSDYAWSPRGDEIAYSTGSGIWLLDLASGRRRQLASFGDRPAWSPDGLHVAFTAGGECRNRSGIYRIDLTSQPPLRITNDCRILGTSGHDVLAGTPLADVILGLGGDDRLTAVAGDFAGDTLDGGSGDDVLVGSYRSDTLDGGQGDDILRGGASGDVLVGGPGRDVLEGQGGRDVIYARDGERDVVSCGTNVGRTTGPENDIAYVDRLDRVLPGCEWVYLPGPAPPVHGRTRLVITISSQATAKVKRVYLLACRPAGGTLPHPGRACARLAMIQNPFAPLPPGLPCASDYAGDELASVRGLYGGRRVAAVFSRTSDCSIRQWDRLAFLFPAA